MSYEKKTDLEMIREGLAWCTKFNQYALSPTENTYSLVYEKAWIKLIRRIKDYAQDNDKLIDLYKKTKEATAFDQETRNIICRLLQTEGKKRQLVYFDSTEEITQMLASGDFKLNDQQSLETN